MSAQERDVLRACAVEGRTAQRKASAEQSVKSLANLKAQGLEVNEVPPAEMKRIREKSQVIYERNSASIGKDTIDLVLGEPRPWTPGPVLSNSFGFGGHNGCLIVAPPG